jgi:hypothetical protein
MVNGWAGRHARLRSAAQRYEINSSEADRREQTLCSVGIEHVKSSKEKKRQQ